MTGKYDSCSCRWRDFWFHSGYSCSQNGCRSLLIEQYGFWRVFEEMGVGHDL